MKELSFNVSQFPFNQIMCVCVLQQRSTCSANQCLCDSATALLILLVRPPSHFCVFGRPWCIREMGHVDGCVAFLAMQLIVCLSARDKTTLRVWAFSKKTFTVFFQTNYGCCRWGCGHVYFEGIAMIFRVLR